MTDLSLVYTLYVAVQGRVELQEVGVYILGLG